MDRKALEKIALSVRSLSMDAVEAAKSGHPGLPLGAAEIGAVLFGEVLRLSPHDPAWINRDRFVLSAGHGSMWLYSLLHLAGFDLPLDEIKRFRQLGSKTPGHPEYGHTAGVETTTGPLGQGFANAVGMAIAQEMLAARFNTPEFPLIDHYVYALAGDGCLMEGVSAEAASLAGHLKLGRLIVFYDSNRITIEGETDLAFTEDVGARFSAYGWQVLEGDGYDMEGILSLVEKAKAERERPTLIILHTTIGKGAPNKAGSHEVHGAPLGPEEVKASKRRLGIPEDVQFYVAPEAYAYFEERRKAWRGEYDRWQRMFSEWARTYPEKKAEWDRFFGPVDLSKVSFPSFERGSKVATRKASGEVLKALAAGVPNLVGGSADLAPSNNTALPGYGDFSVEDRTGRTLHYGVREHAMGAVANGIALYGGLRTFCATFLVFSDYMRPPIRLAALMGLPVTYVFTHDSIFVGEDGPTHQPVEHLASLRAIPNLLVLRPGDAEETVLAWRLAMESSSTPVVLALSRQGLPVYEKPAAWEEDARRGAYVVKDCEGTPDVVVVATGSEVSLALAAAGEAEGRRVRVVSMLSRELFLSQDEAFRERIVPRDVRTVVVEAGVALGWEGFVARRDDLVTLDRFGLSGPGGQVAEALGLSKERVKQRIMGQ
ncbi:transketolase [Spirochaeta thermophila]|uniref:Transketolase n=1 Tax=Winmispira thermophila (strain ATCC 49972 / DSM 6192 / RI 19.B1) TaxID=665571 RepID=E0RNB0_WINT6|nr:transketolase [Spirochaeta thermophila]ADN01110.1 transketolase [Spirochaeta thermophila DSM 6192]